MSRGRFASSSQHNFLGVISNLILVGIFDLRGGGGVGWISKKGFFRVKFLPLLQGFLFITIFPEGKSCKWAPLRPGRTWARASPSACATPPAPCAWIWVDLRNIYKKNCDVNYYPWCFILWIKMIRKCKWELIHLIMHDLQPPYCKFKL